MGQQDPTVPHQRRAASNMQVFNNTMMAPERALPPQEPFLTVYSPEHHGMGCSHAASDGDSGIITYPSYFNMDSQSIGLPEYEGKDNEFYAAENSRWTANRTFSSNDHEMDRSLWYHSICTCISTCSYCATNDHSSKRTSVG